MSLPDSAEYWWDVKRNYPYMGRQFSHIPNAVCGHRHLHEAKRLGDVNCFACLKLIEGGYEHNLPEGITESNGAKKRRLKMERIQREQKEFEDKYGRCSCGCSWVIRKNGKTGEEFLGCHHYPKCKNTKSLKVCQSESA